MGFDQELGADFPHLYARLFRDLCRYLGAAGFILFLDVATAFAVMLRRILFDVESGDEAWLHSLHATGFSRDDISIIYNQIRSHAACASASASTPARSQLGVQSPALIGLVAFAPKT